MIKRLVLAIVLGCSLLLPGLEVAADSDQRPVAEQKQECTVYVTRTGYRYHQGWCRYLRQSKIPILRAKAIKSGYTPCRVCGGSDCE
jgi:hypothetical protein